MTSNLNKAFMRAYAKDRSATADNATDNAPTTPPAATPGAPTAVVQPAVTATQTTVNPSRIAQVAQPSMEPTVFAGRFTPTAPTSPNTHRIPAPGVPVPSQSSGAQPTAVQPTVAQPTVAQPTVVQPKTAQARVVTGAPRPTANQPTRIEKVQASSTDDASRVWQRIDAAHDAQATHPTPPQARPTVSVTATRSAAPKRMQAAAAPAPTVPASGLRADVAATTGSRPLPLVGDDLSNQAETQQVEARRRTVADFLYSAGQYNPGRILASAESAEAMSMSGSSATMPMGTVSMPSSEMVHPTAHAIDNSMAPGSALNNVQASVAPTYPSHNMESSAEESATRRVGQILRVDVPRSASQTVTAAQPVASMASTVKSATAMSSAAMSSAVMSSAAMPNASINSASMATASMSGSQSTATRSMPTATPNRPAGGASAAMPMQSTMQSMPRQSVPVQDMPAPPVPASPATSPSSFDAPVAKYVLEQRRIDRAHKLNEAEQKLRHNTHKIFNPVWEVDSLQWPAVVDKLMQQRAQSMSHVAEHLKTACQDGLSVLGVTSASQGEGRTTVACCLARLAAAHGLNVVLVDIDLDHPTLCVQTNMEVELDWRDCLSEDVTLEEVAVHSIDDQLTVLPLKPRGGRPGLLASDARIADILTDLSECFELVIVDCSKTTSSGNIITGLSHTKIFDAAILVVDRRDGEADRVEDAVRIIQQTGIESIGIVDNFSM